MIDRRLPNCDSANGSDTESERDVRPPEAPAGLDQLCSRQAPELQMLEVEERQPQVTLEHLVERRVEPSCSHDPAHDQTDRERDGEAASEGQRPPTGAAGIGDLADSREHARDARQLGVAAVREVARLPHGIPLLLEVVQALIVEDPRAAVVQKPQRSIGDAITVDVRERRQAQGHARATLISEPADERNDEVLHHSVRCIGPSAHQVEVAHRRRVRRQHVHERLDAVAVMLTQDEHGRLTQVVGVELSDGEGAFAMPCLGEPRVRDLTELPHRCVVDGAGQFDELAP